MRAPSDDQFSSLLIKLYDAAENPLLWQTFLLDLARLTNSPGAAILRHDLRNNQAAGAIAGYDPREIPLYFEHYAQINPWALTAKNGVSHGAVAPGEAAIPLAQVKQTEFYADFGKRNEIAHTLRVEVEFAPDRIMYLCLNRGERAGAYEDDEQQFMRFLAPHLCRALSINEKLAAANQLACASSGRVAFLLDSLGHVVHMTPSATMLLAAQSVLRLERNSLAPLHRDDRRSFQEMLARAIRSRSRLPVMLRVRGKKREFVLILQWLRNGPDSVFALNESNYISLAVIDALPCNATAIESLSMAYGLTRAEARFVAALVQQGSIDRACEQLSLSRNTAKTHMSRIFAKTGTSRSGEVIRIFSAVTAITHMGDESHGTAE